MKLKELHKKLIVEEKEKQNELVQSQTGRNQKIDMCTSNCAIKYSDSKKSRDDVQAQFTREYIAKVKFTNYTREELDKNFSYGYDVIMKGQDYFSCLKKCNMPKNVSGRAAK